MRLLLCGRHLFVLPVLGKITAISVVFRVVVKDMYLDAVVYVDVGNRSEHGCYGWVDQK